MAQPQLSDKDKAFLETRLRSILGSQGVVRVRAIQGKNLIAADIGNTSDPYVIFKLGAHEWRTGVVKKTLNPVWNQETMFALEDGVSPVLSIQVYDKDFGSKDDFLGQAHLNIAQVPVLERTKKWIKLCNPKDASQDCGQILLEITTTPPDLTRGLTPEYRQVIENGCRAIMFAAYKRERRATHGAGISAKGTLRVINDPRLSGHSFFRGGASYPITLRHSNLKGSEDDRFVDSRGCAIRVFDLVHEGEIVGDFLTNTGVTFGTGVARDFVEYFAAQANPEHLHAVMDRLPTVLASLKGSLRNPDSYSNLTYISFTTYATIINGRKYFLRYRVVPHHKQPDHQFWIDPARFGPYDDSFKPAADDPREPRYLRHEFAQRVTHGGVKYILQIQLRDMDSEDPHHPALNAAVAWPEDIPHIDAAEIELNALVPYEEGNYINTNPFYTVPGVLIPPATASDQYASLLHFRWFGYLASALGRMAKEPLLALPNHNTVKYTINLKTGDYKGAGTDEKVLIRLENAAGYSTHEIVLDNALRNDFERNHVDVFQVNAEDVGLVETIYIYHGLNTKGKHAREEWFVEWVTVEHQPTKQKAVFPVHQWCPASGLISVAGEALLPQHDLKRHDARRQEIEAKRALYNYTINIPGFPPRIKDLPSNEQFDEAALEDLDTYQKKAGINRVGAGVVTLFTRLDEMKDFYMIYPFFKIPEVSKRWKLDEEFGAQRLNGVNPLSLRRLTSVPLNFPVTRELVQRFMRPGFDLDTAMAAGHIYLADYSILDGIPIKHGFYLAAPLAMFCVGADGKLRPIAIQLNQAPHPVDNPIFTPADEEHLWTLAKMNVACADGQVHQCASHLMGTHIVMEAFVITMQRNLSMGHPLLRMMTPHFKHNLAINTRGLFRLLAPGGWMDKTMSCGSQGAEEVMRRFYANWTLEGSSLPAFLKSRGIDSAEALPNFHYRDDGLLVWNSIHDFVTDFIHYVYPTPDHLAYDWELQNFARELVAQDGGRMHGIFGTAEIRTHEQLIAIITEALWTVSAQHGSLNFPQYDYYGFIPNAPGAIRAPLPKKGQIVTEADILAALPNVQETLDQATVVFLLSRPSLSRLGEYDLDLLQDEGYKRIYDKWHASLKAVSAQIKERNTRREVPYRFLDPEFIPNSIAM